MTGSTGSIQIAAEDLIEEKISAELYLRDIRDSVVIEVSVADWHQRWLNYLSSGSCTGCFHLVLQVLSWPQSRVQWFGGEDGAATSNDNGCERV
jgi:hypothetical protein